jgi:hypothetical protein
MLWRACSRCRGPYRQAWCEEATRAPMKMSSLRRACAERLVVAEVEEAVRSSRGHCRALIGFAAGAVGICLHFMHEKLTDDLITPSS